MPRIIPNLRALGNRRDLMLPLLIVLVGTASFGLGRLSALEERRGAVRLDVAPELMSASAVQANSSPEANAEKQASDSAAPEQQSAPGQFVASRGGVAYHYPWCSGAKRINDENKIFFASRTEAEEAGYRAAKNCPGL